MKKLKTAILLTTLFISSLSFAGKGPVKFLLNAVLLSQGLSSGALGVDPSGEEFQIMIPNGSNFTHYWTYHWGGGYHPDWYENSYVFLLSQSLPELHHKDRFVHRASNIAMADCDVPEGSAQRPLPDVLHATRVVSRDVIRHSENYDWRVVSQKETVYFTLGHIPFSTVRTLHEENQVCSSEELSD